MSNKLTTIFLILNILFLTFVTSCSQTNNIPGFTEYQSEEQDSYQLETNFSINHPDGWEVITPPEILAFVVVPPDYQNSKIKVSVIIFPLELEGSFIDVELENKEVLNIFALIFELDKAPDNLEKLTVNGSPAERFYTDSGEFTNEIIIIGKGKSRFVLGGYASTNNQDEKDLMEAIIKSFEIRK